MTREEADAIEAKLAERKKKMRAKTMPRALVLEASMIMIRMRRDSEELAYLLGANLRPTKAKKFWDLRTKIWEMFYELEYFAEDRATLDFMDGLRGTLNAELRGQRATISLVPEGSPHLAPTDPASVCSEAPEQP